MGLVTAWMRGHARTYDYACEGRSSEEAMWWILLAQEGYAAQGSDAPWSRAMATMLLDVRKCFDTTSCEQLWRWGRHHGFPRVLLRMALKTFEQPEG